VSDVLAAVVLFFLWGKVAENPLPVVPFTLSVAGFFLFFFFLKGFESQRLRSPRFCFTSLTISLFLCFVLLLLFSAFSGSLSLYLLLSPVLIPYVLLLSLVNPLLFRSLCRKPLVVEVPEDFPFELRAQIQKKAGLPITWKVPPRFENWQRLFHNLSALLNYIPPSLAARYSAEFSRSLASRKSPHTWQRMLDLVISVPLSIILLPAIGCIALLIFLSDGRPVFFVQQRVGMREKPFQLVKFRTLKNGHPLSDIAEEDHALRSFSVGKFLRSMRLDELPQLWNVLKGEMSLVGPRPEMPFFYERSKRSIPFYEFRSSVLPGITGWAQVHYKRSFTPEEYETKTSYDLAFLLLFSPSLYFKCLGFTLDAIVYRKDGE